jgi:dihydroxyacetone kinase-like predicted kinase
MDEQHIEFLILHQEKMTKLGTAVITVAVGDGIVNVFSDLGVSAIIPGGQTMNPSTMDMLQTVEQVISDNVIFLPNNKNVIPTALLLQSMSKKNIRVIPTETIPQGISALIAFVPESDFETNAAEMEEAIKVVKTIEITNATRTTKVGKINIRKGEKIGLLDSELLAVGDSSKDVILQLLDRIDLAEADILTLYHGKDTDESEAGQISTKIGRLYPGLKIGVVNGGQPNYLYIISIE